MALPLRSLNHISHVCADVEKTKRFYRDVLGFVEIKRPASLDFEGSWLFNYGVGIHLIGGDPVPRASRINPQADHLSFQSDSLVEVERRLAEAGITYEKGWVEEGGVRISQVFFHDPDNHMIEICNCDCLPVMPLTDLQLQQPMACKLSLSGPVSSDNTGCLSMSRQNSFTSSQGSIQPVQYMHTA